MKCQRCCYERCCTWLGFVGVSDEVRKVVEMLACIYRQKVGRCTKVVERLTNSPARISLFAFVLEVEGVSELRRLRRIRTFALSLNSESCL